MGNILGFLLINAYALLIIVTTVIIFFSKKRSKQFEDETYKNFLIATLFISISGIILGFAVTPSFNISSLIIKILNKIYLICLISWISIMTFYFMSISLKNKSKKPKMRKVFTVIAIISIIFVLILPITVITSESGATGEGPAMMFAYMIFGIGFFTQVLCLFINHKNIKSKKYVPLYMFIVLGAVSVGLLILNPTLNYIINPVFIYIAFIMFHTIENPDMQMIETLLRNKELVEETINDKSNFLFKVSQEMKKPIANILDNVKAYQNVTTDTEKENLLLKIEQEANNAFFIINDITDVSSMDYKKIKMQDNEYITKKIFVDVESYAKNSLSLSSKTDKIVFNTKIHNSYPEKLCGDYIKLKQILLSIISNSIKYTEEGFIDFEVDSVTRYDTCRLIFTIKDSGIGMSITEINKLLSSNEELTSEEFEKIDSLDLKMPVVIKIIKMLGGSISIRSEGDKGTIVVVVIDQKISKTDSDIQIENAKKQSATIKTKRRVLIVDDRIDQLEKLQRIMSKNNVDVVTTLIGRDVIDKINAGDQYDFIIMRDEMKPDSAYNILKELKDIKKFNIPVVITITKDKELIKDHFIKDGFKDIIFEEKIEDEVKRICDKYI